MITIMQKQNDPYRQSQKRMTTLGLRKGLRAGGCFIYPFTRKCL